MAEYESPQISTDPTELAQLAFDYLTTQIPGFLPAPGGLDTWMVEANAQIGSEVRDMAVDVPPSIFQYLGATLHDIPPIEAERATAQSTWTMINNAGYTIPAGTVVAIPGSDPSVLVPFEVAVEVVVAPGSTVTGAGAVSLVALEAGAAANDASGTPQLIDNLAYVASVAITSGPTGGLDEEDNLTYLDRLTSKLQLLAPRPILPDDFAVLAREVTGVHRATAIDGLIPGNVPETGNERAVAIVAITEAGAAVSAGVKTAIATALEAQREVNFVVSVTDPTFTTVDVTFTFTPESEWEAADVEIRAEAAVTTYLSPATWGVPTHGDDRAWENRTVVRLGDLYAALKAVPGLAYVNTLTLRKGADPFTAADVPLTGYAPLPQPGVVSGSVAP